MGDFEKKNFMARFGSAESLDHHNLIDDWHGSRAAAMNPNLRDDQLEKILACDHNSMAQKRAIQHQAHRMSDHQMERALKDSHLQETAIDHIHNPKHIDMVLHQTTNSWEKGGFNMVRRANIHAALRRAVKINAMTPDREGDFLDRIDHIGDENLTRSARSEINMERTHKAFANRMDIRT